MLRFYLSCLLAFTGGHMVNYTVILYLQEKVGSDWLSGVGFGLSFGSSIVFGWFAGVLCDRIAPSRVIHGAQTLFLLCLAGLWWTDAGASDQSRVAWILFSAFLGGLAWSFVGPARLATLGQIAPAGKLKPATIIFNLQVLLGFGLAPVIIGVVRSHAGWPTVFATGMGLFVASSLLLLGTQTHGSDRPRLGVAQELREGFAAVGANPLLAQLIVAAIVAYAMTGPMQILLPKLAREILGLSELQRGGYLGLMALAASEGAPDYVVTFVSKMSRAANIASQQSGVPARLILSQAALESGWGRREIKGEDGSPTYNLFGIKVGSYWKGKVVNVMTTEYENGVPRKVVQPFRAYSSYEEAFADYARLLGDSPRYEGVATASTEIEAARRIQQAGYATDPRYAEKLIGIMSQFRKGEGPVAGGGL